MNGMDETLIRAGRSFYGICIAALGIQQLFYADFRPVILPPWPPSIPGLAPCAYLASAALIAAGVAIVLGQKARTVALILGGMFLALVVFCHLPYMLFVNPYTKHLGVWTDAFKELALAGGAFVVAGSLPEENGNAGAKPALMRLLEKFIPLGRIFFSITMVTFGIDHFLYPEFVEKLVPAWIPGHVFWTYFAGSALIASGVAVILKVKLRVVALLQGTMIFLWFVLLHIPRAIADPHAGKGNEITSAAEALGFSGTAFVFAYGGRLREKITELAGLRR